MDALDQGLLEYCRSIGLPEAELSNDELLLAVGDHLVTFAIDRVRGEVVVFAAAGQVEPDAEALRRVLELNHLGQATGGFSLGLEPGSAMVVLSHRLDAEALRAGRLHVDVDRFVTVLDRFRDGFDPQPPPGAAAQPAPGGDWIRI